MHGACVHRPPVIGVVWLLSILPATGKHSASLTSTRQMLWCCSSRTAMIATVSAGIGQYHHTVNTLKYADRAKEIKTHVRRNTASVAVHVAQMRAIILQLQQQNQALKSMLSSPAVSCTYPLEPTGTCLGCEDTDDAASGCRPPSCSCSSTIRR